MVRQSNSLASSPQEVCPLLPGTSVPDITVQAIDGSQVNLADLVRERPAIIVFYRGGW